ncbi:MAG: HPr family phosphocarrier protein [Clostridia bacterium]|nr:HPr family phosphocarrier protein [Clostridia bacterium]
MKKETFVYTVTDPNGLHARPAGLLVRKAQELKGEVTISLRDRSASLKKLLAVMGLGIRHGDTVTVTVESEHAAEDAARLQRFFSEHV